MSSVSKITVLILLFAAGAMADVNKVGNGGNVVKCVRDDHAEYTLLDFHEQGVVAKSDVPEVDAAKSALEKIKKVAPRLYQQYLKRLNSIQSEISYRTDIEIVEIPDSKHLFKPLEKNCSVVQAAVRDNGATDSKKRFLIRKDIWDAMPSAQRAGLLTHEIIHEHLTKLGEENSIKARKINAFLYDDSKKSNSFWEMVTNLRIPVYP